MATKDEEKRNVYGGQYDQQINDLYGQIQDRPGFSYDLNGDALWQQYKDRYTQNAKRSMRDTMGQATGLTGGYGSTYAQGVGQQAYDEQMRGLTDKVPELADRAYKRWQDEGDQILTQYNLANQLGAADQATRQYQQEWDFNQKKYNDTQAQQAYANLSTAILQSGYQPSEDELTAAGMTQEQANALRQAWVGSNPGLAYMSGALSGEDYYKLTGAYPPGYQVPGAGGGGWYGGGSKYNEDIANLQRTINQNTVVTGSKPVAVTGKANDETTAAARKLYEYNERLKTHYGV